MGDAYVCRVWLVADNNSWDITSSAIAVLIFALVICTLESIRNWAQC
jgi:hypothetical protein